MLAMCVRQFGLAGLLAGFCSLSAGGTFQESFGSDPGLSGWKAFGDGNLFKWSSSASSLEVTWDSSRPNSYYARSLGVTLGIEDDFSLEFDLRLADFTAGVNPQKPNPFQLAVGLINLAEATGEGFVRGTGSDSPDLVEFSFFPDPGGAWQWGPSVTTALIDSTGTNWSGGGFLPQNLSTGDLYRIKMVYTASDKVLRTTILRNGEAYATLDNSSLSSPFTTFRVDHVAFCSFADAGQDPAYSGSILAHGEVDNISITTPQPAITDLSGAFVNGIWQAQFRAAANWSYTLERTSDWILWNPVTTSASDAESVLVLSDTNAPTAQAFYRIRAERK